MKTMHAENYECSVYEVAGSSGELFSFTTQTIPWEGVLLTRGGKDYVVVRVEMLINDVYNDQWLSHSGVSHINIYVRYA